MQNYNNECVAIAITDFYAWLDCKLIPFGIIYTTGLLLLSTFMRDFTCVVRL